VTLFTIIGGVVARREFPDRGLDASKLDFLDPELFAFEVTGKMSL
jgi:hypothetical protein